MESTSEKTVVLSLTCILYLINAYMRRIQCVRFLFIVHFINCL